MTIALITEGFVADAGTGTAPVIASVSPTPNTTPGTGGAMPSVYASARYTPVVVQITDADGAGDIKLVSISAVFLDGTVETVYRGSNFMGDYIERSFPVALTTGVELHILRDTGWPGATSAANLAVGLLIDVSDGGGNHASASLYYQMPRSTPIPPLPTSVAAGADDLIEHGLDRLIWQLRS